MQNSKSTAQPLGSLQLWELKRKNEFIRHIVAKLNLPHLLKKNRDEDDDGVIPNNAYSLYHNLKTT